MTRLRAGYNKDWTRIKGWQHRFGPLRISRIGSWEMYVPGPSVWRVGRTLCFRYGTIVVNLF